ncbi:RagB/SusD family nutrient uptake outer membrane protein [Gaoshiqia sp. Z1-71]|uniref:RagB/SusD family nutrient uptake outer membrane protein n=1 Tax=Gaoshiqia hydrogeniformans TaxID=3290090 RepID=UPI003BF91C94
MKNYIIGLVIVAGIIFASCSDQLDLEPANSITDEQIKELLASGDEATIDLIISSMANTMPTQFNASGLNGAGTADGRYRSIQGLEAMRNLEGNDIVFGNKNLSIFGADEYYLRDFTSTSVDKNLYYWNHMWSVITTANKMLTYLDDEIVGSNIKLKEYKARGLVARAYAYNYLMENYQDSYLQGGNTKLGIMLYDTYSPTQPNKARASSTDTYDFIKNDLTKAISLMTDAAKGYTIETLTDIDLSVAKFLLARVCLITGDWTTAISACNDILAKYPTLMGQSVYGGVNNVGTTANPEIRPETNGFLYNNVNPEVILGWPVGEALTAHNGWMNPFAEGYGGLSEGFARIDNRLYEKIDNRDYRKNCFMATDFGDYAYPTNATVRYIPAYTNLKFAATHGIGTDDKKNVGTVTCYAMRSSEVLLMKAEAQAQAGSSNEAKATLNILLAARTKTGETPLTCDTYSSMTGMTALQMVQLQTRIELWGEGGREFFNNKRWGIPVDRTSSSNHIDKGTYSVANMTLKIPEDEILYNPLCVQN